MRYRIKIRWRDTPPSPWKWEIHQERLITSGHKSYATHAEAYDAGQAVLADMVLKLPRTGPIARRRR